jgi:hypothetical protein
MELNNLKPIGVGYLSFAILSAFLYDIGKVSIFPIMICVILFLLYFLINGIIKLRISKKWDWVDFTFLWGIPLLISLQILLLFGDSFKLYSLVFSTIVMFLLWFLAYRYKREGGVSFFIFMLSLVTGTFNSMF